MAVVEDRFTISHLSVTPPRGILPHRGRSCGEVAGSRVIETVDRSLVRPGDQVAVDVDRDLDRMVAHLVPDIGQGLALADQERGKRVPERVGLPVADFRPLE